MAEKCPNCSEILYSKFDTAYVFEVGLCYTCDTDEGAQDTAWMILKVLEEKDELLQR